MSERDEYENIELELTEAQELMVKVFMFDGALQERERIRAWVEEHRSAIEIADDVVMYRDHFDSESLLEFLDKGDKKEEEEK